MPIANHREPLRMQIGVENGVRAAVPIQAASTSGPNASPDRVETAVEPPLAAELRRQVNAHCVQPVPGADRVCTALAMILQEGADFAVGGTPKSQLKGLSGNSSPGETPIAWLRGQNKCSFFAGEVLTRSGYDAPTHKMSDGSLHYRAADDWPEFSPKPGEKLKSRHLFERVTDARQARPGDVLVFDDTSARGANTAHVDILITGTLKAGAYTEGADISVIGDRLKSLQPDPERGSWRGGFTDREGKTSEIELFILRPRKDR